MDEFAKSDRNRFVYYNAAHAAVPAWFAVKLHLRDPDLALLR